MAEHRHEASPHWRSGAEPVKFRCEGGVVHLWVYPDGTIEVPCKCTSLKREGYHARHLYNPATGVHITDYLRKPD